MHLKVSEALNTSLVKKIVQPKQFVYTFAVSSIDFIMLRYFGLELNSHIQFNKVPRSPFHEAVYDRTNS